MHNFLIRIEVIIFFNNNNFSYYFYNFCFLFLAIATLPDCNLARLLKIEEFSRNKLNSYYDDDDNEKWDVF